MRKLIRAVMRKLIESHEKLIRAVMKNGLSERYGQDHEKRGERS